MFYSCLIVVLWQAVQDRGGPKSESERAPVWPPNRVGARLWSRDSRLLLNPRLFGSFPRLCVAVWKTSLTFAESGKRESLFSRLGCVSRLPDCWVQSGYPTVECPTVSPTLSCGQFFFQFSMNQHGLCNNVGSKMAIYFGWRACFVVF